MSAGGEIIEGLVKVVFRQGAKRIGKMVTGAIGKKLSKDEAKEALEKIAEQKLAKATRKAKGLGKAKRPGCKKGDVDSYEKLSPGKNRAPGHHNTAADNRVQAHHPIQTEWDERNIKGYDKNKPPSVLLESSSGKPHAKVSAAQRARRRAEGYGNDIKFEFNKGYKELIDAGVDPKTARKAMNDAYKYLIV